jgi:hypothetical protein
LLGGLSDGPTTIPPSDPPSSGSPDTKERLDVGPSWSACGLTNRVGTPSTNESTSEGDRRETTRSDGVVAAPLTRTLGAQIREIGDPTPETESILGFLTLSEIGKAFNVSDYSVAEEVRIVTDIARNNPKGDTKLRAVAYLRNLATTAARMAGYVGESTLHMTQGEDGTRTLTHTERTLRLLADRKSEAEAALASPVSGEHPPIEGEYRVVSGESSEHPVHPSPPPIHGGEGDGGTESSPRHL